MIISTSSELIILVINFHLYKLFFQLYCNLLSAIKNMLLSAIKQHLYLRSIKFIELDYGKILTGKPIQFDGKNHGFL